MSRRVLVLGASGFLGSYLYPHLKSAGHEVTGTYFGNPRDTLVQLDLHDQGAARELVKEVDPEVVLFLSGSKDVALCQRDPAHAVEKNLDTIRSLLAACATGCRSPHLIYFSTDYVFDGVQGGYRSTDQATPRTVYGLTKALAERLILASGLNCTILRASAVMGRSGGFFAWLESRLSEADEIELFNNTYFSPTSIGNLCDFVSSLLNDSLDSKTVRNYSDGYRLSRYQFASLVATRTGRSLGRLIETTADFESSLFQPDVSLIPDGSSSFRDPQSWNELARIY